jgi:DNA-binding beta-propeller fold protein YncE
MKFLSSVLFCLCIVLSLYCGGDKIALPTQPDLSQDDLAISDTSYLQLRPVWGPETGYDLSQPRDVLLGNEPLVYIADTGNDRILMLDLAGNILGQSQAVENPVALDQDTKLNLIIVTDSNKIYRINLVAVNHQIADAPVELVFEEVDNPDRKFTGVAALLRNVQGRSVIRYWVTATGPKERDNQVLFFDDFDVNPSSAFLINNGLGILTASSPSGITTLRNFLDDFIFCMIGENSFKVQWINAGVFPFAPRLVPGQGDFDILVPGKFSQPEDVTVDPTGNIFVVDSDLDYLFKFSPSGEEQQSFGGTGSGENQFDNPNGVGFFNQTLYVADTGNNRIVRFKLSTEIEQ